MEQDFDFKYEEYDYEYKDLYSLKGIADHLHKISIRVTDFTYKAVLNDLRDIENKLFEETIIITASNPEALNINVLDGNNHEVANFDLHFNEKYPFEPPRLTFHSPGYNFGTNLSLSFDFKKFLHSEWSLHENLHTIILFIISIVLHQEKKNHLFCFDDTELMFIDLLKEINYFRDACQFDEFKKKYDPGRGVGYGDTTSFSKQVENRENQRTILFQKCAQMMDSNDEFKQFAIQNNLIDSMRQFLSNSSFIFVHKNKEFFNYWRTFNNEEYNEAFRSKVSMDRMIQSLEKSKNLILDDNQVSQGHFYKEKSVIQSAKTAKLFKRILIEMMDLDEFGKESDCFFFAWSSSSFNIFRFVIGSENEPYFGGLFEFDAYFPPDYPDCPPMVHLITTGRNTIRFNPNLYSDGKVCLSLLGTWAGEQWNPNINTFLHVIHAINAMILNDNPVQNEPAYSSDLYFDHPEKPLTKELLLVKKYKLQIKFFTLKYAILDHLKSDSILGQKNKDYFMQKKDKILKSFDDYLRIDDETMKSIISATSFQCNNQEIFKNYKASLSELIQEFRLYQ